MLVFFVIIGARFIPKANRDKWNQHNRWKAQHADHLRTFQAQLSPEQEYDLLDLFKHDCVSATGKGQSITAIDVELKNLMRLSLKIVICPGTYFVSTGAHQNMVMRTKHRLQLKSGEAAAITMSASCINATRPIPGEKDQFKGVSRASENLIRFLEATHDENDKVVQAGVWAITDGYSGAEVQARLVQRTAGGSTQPAITNYQIRRARDILNQLGIKHHL